jgi:electron transfer flavoprotein alpha subunit
MSVLFLIETIDGKIKKNAYESATYAAKVAAAKGGEAIGIALGTASESDLAGLGEYGAKKVLHANHTGFDKFDSGVYAQAIADAANQIGAKVIIISQSLNGKAIAPRVAVKLNAGIVAGAVALPDADFAIKKAAFSGKAFAYVKVNSDVKVIGVVPSSVGAEKTGGSATVEASSISATASKVTVKEVKRQVGDTLPLPEAELVVSAGRGMKGPENWGIVEDLAKALGATTACSRPVADVGWRPHHEHVGQTGVAIRPNLYIAIGISGAIQHLAGVNQSKCIVVINKDSEAPFFKAADYGVVGDAFEVVPRLTEAIKKFKASQH